MDSKHLAAIDQQETQINQSVYKIAQVILDLQNLLDSNDAALFLKTHRGLKNLRIFVRSFMLFYQHLYPKISKENKSSNSLECCRNY